MTGQKSKKASTIVCLLIILIAGFFTGFVLSSPTSLFSDGFENGLANWSGSQNTASVVSNVFHSGEHSLACSNTFTMAYKDLPYVEKLTFEYYVRFGSTLDVPGSEIVFSVLMQRPWTWLYAVGLANIGGTVYWSGNNAGYHKFSQTMTNPSADIWYKVQIQVKCSSKGDGEIRVYVNDVELTDLRQMGINTAYSNIARAAVGMVYCNGWPSTESIFIDDVKIGTDILAPSTPTPTPTPTVTPTPTTTPNPSPSPPSNPTPNAQTVTNSLTGFGGDYALYFNDGSVEAWINSGLINRVDEFRKKGYVAARLCFEFGHSTCMSTLDYTKFDRLLEIFDSVSVKVIPTSWDDQTFSSAFLANHRNNWLNFVSHYKGDQRIAAISLFNEPTSRILTASMSKSEFQHFAANLVRDIHAIDPNRVCIFPIPILMYGSFDQWLPDLKATGILSEPNVVFDIAHPYFFENDYDMGKNPEQKASWYGYAWIAPAVSAFGSDRCYAGETFAWVGESTLPTANYPSHTPNVALQKRWLVAIINEFNRQDISFCTWCSLHGQKWIAFEDIVHQITFGN